MDGVTVPGCFIRYVNRCKIVLRCSQASCRCVHRAIQLYDRNRAIRVNIYHFFFIFFGSICLLYCTTNYNICVFVETALFDRFFFFCKYFYGILEILIFEKNVLMKIFRIFSVPFVRLIINFFENLNYTPFLLNITMILLKFRFYFHLLCHLSFVLITQSVNSFKAQEDYCDCSFPHKQTFFVRARYQRSS